MNTKTLSAVATLAALSISTLASAQHADLLVIRDDAGNLVTGQYDFDDGSVVNTNTRVYEGEFDAFGTTDEPGFNALSGSNIPVGYQALSGNTALSFDARSFSIGETSANLFYWDGQGEVNFGAAANTLTISKAPSSIFSATLDGSDSSVEGFDIDTTSSDGFMHKHIDAGLSDISASAHGFYMWSLTLEHESDSTDPIFFIHGFGLEDEEAHEMAIDWANANLVPAPGSVALLLGLPALWTRRR